MEGSSVPDVAPSADRLERGREDGAAQLTELTELRLDAVGDTLTQVLVIVLRLLLVALDDRRR